jgi:hypothetical protein
MHFILPDVVNPMYIHYVAVVLLTIQNTVRICSKITVLIGHYLYILTSHHHIQYCTTSALEILSLNNPRIYNSTEE